MKIIKLWKSKLVIAGIVLLFFLCMQLTVNASESKSVDPSKVELPIPVQDTEYEELDPTQILNMKDLLPEESEISALGEVPKGAGSVIESETSGAVQTPEGKEFYIIQTKDEETFFLVIDHAKASDNVYFLSQINGSALTGNQTNPEDNPEETETDNSFLDSEDEQTLPTEESKEKLPQEGDEGTKEIPADSPETEKGGGAFIFILIIAIVFGVGYYTKIYKPKKKVLDEALDFESDFEGMHDDVFTESEEEAEEDEFEEEEEEDEEPEEEWEEPVVEKKKRKPVVQQKRQTPKVEPTIIQKEQPKASGIGTVFNIFVKFIFGFVLLGLVSLGLTVLTNESLRNMIMETVKNYF